MDQVCTWHGGGPRPRPHCARWGPSSPSQKGGAPSPIFGPCLLWRNSWMDQDVTWCGGRPRPRPHCVRWGPASPPPKKKGTDPQFQPMSVPLWPNGWIPLGMEEGLGPYHIVLAGAQFSHLTKGHSPHFSAHVNCGQTAGWIKMPLGNKVGLGSGHIVLHGDPAPPKGRRQLGYEIL